MMHPFSAKEMLALPNAGGAVANPAGTFAIIPVSQWSWDLKKSIKTLVLASLVDGDDEIRTLSPEGSLDFVWLNDTHIAIVQPFKEVEGKTASGCNLVSCSIEMDAVSSPVCSFPTSIGNLKYNFAGKLVFSAEVYPDGDLATVEAQDKAIADSGTSGVVYDSLFVRHWDAWKTEKKQKLFVIQLKHVKGAWTKVDDVMLAPLNATELVSPCSSLTNPNLHLLIHAHSGMPCRPVRWCRRL